MVEFLHPIISGGISLLIAASAMIASLRFPMGLAPYVVWYFGVSLLSFLFALIGIPEWSGTLLILSTLFFIVFAIKTPGLKSEFPNPTWQGSILLLLVFGFGCSVLLPAHDPDSQNMHLTVPAYILQKGILFEPQGWFTGRMAGTGEWFSLAGMSLGLDNLQAAVQFGALLVFATDIRKLLRNKVSRDFFELGMWTLPVLLFLIPSQKPQIIGVLAVSWSAIFLMQRDEKIPPTLGLAVALFAVTIKHSFWVTAALPTFFWSARLYKDQQNRGSLRPSEWWPLLMPLPLLLWNLVRWGDPVPPVLTDYLGLENGFLQGYIRDFNRGYFFPLNLIIPKGFGQYAAVLGPSVLFFMAAMYHQKSRRIRLYFTLATLLAVLLLPTEARFYTEFALVGLFIIANGLMSESTLKRWKLVFIPMAWISLAAMYLFVLPRISMLVAGSSREAFNHRYAFDFQPAEWVKKVIPTGSPDISYSDSRLFYAPETIGKDVIFEMRRDPDFWKNQFKTKDSLWLFVREADSVRNDFPAEISLTAYAKADFARITRNPANRKTETYRIFVARLKPTP